MNTPDSTPSNPPRYLLPFRTQDLIQELVDTSNVNCPPRFDDMHLLACQVFHSRNGFAKAFDITGREDGHKNDLPLYANQFYDTPQVLPEAKKSVFRRLSDYAAARDRIKLALDNQEKIVIYGDYDVDGISALVQMHDWFIDVGHPSEKLAWFIPDRADDGYGLTDSGVEKCVSEHKPTLLICVDCASTAFKQVALLKAKGIDTIVIDHHELGDLSAPHPAVAHLNPKAGTSTGLDKKLHSLCAAGLVFLFLDCLTSDLSLKTWNRDSALIFAGLGTVVDVMLLFGINRALVWHSIKLFNERISGRTNPKSPGDLIGLLALAEKAGIAEVNSSSYGFALGPRLNAMGRLDHATAAVELLLTANQEEAKAHAETCDTLNRERQKLTNTAASQALELAQTEVQRGAKVIVLYKKEWHPGVVGIVASRVREAFHRPAFLLGWNEENGLCKGSGRSCEGYDMGTAVQEAVKQGCVVSGGGHRMAAGVSLREDQIEAFRKCVNTSCTLTEFTPCYPVLDIGKIEPGNDELDCMEAGITCKALHTAYRFYQNVEPTGQGNEKPLLLITGATFKTGGRSPLKRKSDGGLWAYNDTFVAGSDTFVIQWSVDDLGDHQWGDQPWDLVVKLSQNFSNGRYYINLRGVAARPA